MKAKTTDETTLERQLRHSLVYRHPAYKARRAYMAEQQAQVKAALERTRGRI